MSATGASTIAPTIIPAKAKLNIHPKRSSVKFKSKDTEDATTAMAVISKPSSILNIKHKATTSICCEVMEPLSIKLFRLFIELSMNTISPIIY